ncbi:GNAT family N-acetyltransferase [Falsirhodobacter xinxiangensis]|uniref:GNAT family N-acetyltransferase n=1 Tax=Falsirhodobacter xinxiangensis TaxID=2530049 RepID=UPI0010AA0BCD|nr:GNAT family N-acetyltransferase [Rhodobacter xinxiangensis]
MIVRRLDGAHLDDVARLRIAVFRDWPYIYDGDLDYEREYLRSYADPRAIVVGAFDGDRIVGAATGMPMEDAEDFAFENPEGVFYCAESVLLPEYRGRGIGHRFFDLREDHARALGMTRSAFCSVIRPEDHPLRPTNARTNDAFWRARGYAPMPGVTATFHWRDIGDDRETDKQLQFWIRTL